MSKSENVAHTQSLLLLTFLLMAHGLALAQDDRPNFLVIVADDMGYSDLGSYGGNDDEKVRLILTFLPGRYSMPGVTEVIAHS